MIEFKIHTPWCINCETTSKQMEKLVKHFEGLENLVFARIDASTNEHAHLQVRFLSNTLCASMAFLVGRLVWTVLKGKKRLQSCPL